MEGIRLNRRQFLQVSGASALTLSLQSLGFLRGGAEAAEKVLEEWDYSKWEDLHRKEWAWDKVSWGTHLVDCYPGNCLLRVCTEDGVVIRELPRYCRRLHFLRGWRHDKTRQILHGLLLGSLRLHGPLDLSWGNLPGPDWKSTQRWQNFA